MLSFKADMKVVSDVLCKIQRGAREYDVFLVKTGGVCVKALFYKAKDIKKNVCITSDDVYLTNLGVEDGKDILALRVGVYWIIDEKEVDVDSELVVKTNGKLVKTPKSQIREIGAANRPFIFTILRIKDEEGKLFDAKLIGVYRRAFVLNDLDNNTFIDVKAKLRESEVGLMELSFVEHTIVGRKEV